MTTDDSPSPPATLWDWYKGELPALKPGYYMLIPLAYAIALYGQYRLSIDSGMRTQAGFTYLVAAIMLGVAIAREYTANAQAEEDQPADEAETETAAPSTDLPVVRWAALGAGVLMSGLTYISLGDNEFTTTGVVFWLGSMIAWGVALWDAPLKFDIDWHAWADRVWQGEIAIRLRRGGWFLLAIMLIGAFFRFNRLASVPLEMTSDHVEKIIDTAAVLQGYRPIFMANNGGREPLIFYLLASTATLLDAPLTYTLLKLVTAVVGWLNIPLIYLLGRELTDDERTGLLAALLVAIGWWPNVISRNGLRFPFAPLFTTLVLYFLVRGLRRKRPQDFVLAGLSLGIGFYGYTPIRIVPLAVTLGVLLYWLHHRKAAGVMLNSFWQLVVMGLLTLISVIPFVRYAQDYPEFFWYRTLTRMTSAESELPGSPVAIFLGNAWNSARMFSFSGDAAWLISPAGQPSLDWVMGAIFHMGLVVLLVWYIRRREWQHLFTLLVVPVLLLPSTMALAFPLENPSLHRSGSAIPVVFIIIAVGMNALWRYSEQLLKGRWGVLAGAAVIAALVVISARKNAEIVWETYANQYDSSTQNASEIGQIVESFATSVGSWETVWVRPYVNWVDTRSVGIYANRYGWDNVIHNLDMLEFTQDDPRPKLFILHTEDHETLLRLRELYPNGVLQRHDDSPYIQKRFYVYLVPGEPSDDIFDRIPAQTESETS